MPKIHDKIRCLIEVLKKMLFFLNKNKDDLPNAGHEEKDEYAHQEAEAGEGQTDQTHPGQDR